MKSLENRISADYLAMQIQLHEREGGYGRSGAKHAVPLIAFAKATKSSSILDYGCGEGFLKETLIQKGWGGDISEYDPCVPGADSPPKSADIVACTDVLEHVEPEMLEAVLAHIFELAKKHGYVVISTVTAGKCLSNGRNAHLIVKHEAWWASKLADAGWTIRKRAASHKDATFWLDR
jgi:2-polyprenyl-3-methyl-5-hydroxy-6-metoxy-1,4-benzoquinol methylase